MSKGRALLIAIAIVLFLPSKAMAYSDSVELRKSALEFKRLQLGEPLGNLNEFDVGRFMGYISGVNQMMYYNTDFGICLPKEAGHNGQIADVVIKFLEKHTSLLHKPPLYLMSMAYLEAYPCE